MSDNDQDTILVSVADTTMRGGNVKELKVQVLAENINIFMAQINQMLDKTPEEVGKFKFTKFTVTAQVSAKGGLMLLGTGGEASVSGGLTFEFERK